MRRALSRAHRALLALTSCALLVIIATPARAQHHHREDAERHVYQGDMFYFSGDYYRAITQYELSLMYQASAERADLVRLKIAWTYARAYKRAASAGVLAQVIREREPWDRLGNWAKLYYADLALEAGQAAIALNGYNQLLSGCEDRVAQGDVEADITRQDDHNTSRAPRLTPQDCVDLETYARVGLAKHYTRLNDFDLAIEQLRAIPQQAKDTEKIRALVQHVQGIEIPQKSPFLAGVLSVVPGLGHVYIEDYGAGVVALLWNGAFIYGFVDSILGKRYGQATLIGLVEFIWYSGTIFGAVSGAHRFNRDARKIVEQGLLKDLKSFDDPVPWVGRFGLPPEPLQLNMSVDF